jgi:fluoroacetyl-CoA thioesterase
MKNTLKAGLEYELRYRVPDSKTVPVLYPEAAEFQAMPRVFATGYMVGLIEWACIQAINPHIDWPDEQTVGISINVNHTAATPPGLEVCARVKLMEVDGKRLVFEIQLNDSVDTISKGTHERFIINADKFSQRSKTCRIKKKPHWLPEPAVASDARPLSNWPKRDLPLLRQPGAGSASTKWPKRFRG